MSWQHILLDNCFLKIPLLCVNCPLSLNKFKHVSTGIWVGVSLGTISISEQKAHFEQSCVVCTKCSFFQLNYPSYCYCSWLQALCPFNFCLYVSAKQYKASQEGFKILNKKDYASTYRNMIYILILATQFVIILS